MPSFTLPLLTITDGGAVSPEQLDLLKQACEDHGVSFYSTAASSSCSS